MKLGWQKEWEAISNRIKALIDAGNLFLKTYAVQASDTNRVMDKYLVPHANGIYYSIEKFINDFSDSIPEKARPCLKAFLSNYSSYLPKAGERPSLTLKGMEGLKLYLTILASFRAEFEYHLEDREFVICKLVEKSFIHLQRLIIVDPEYQEKWEKAFNEGETSCEKLGAVHLLSHGIWAFKANAAGERTDLILRNTINKDVLATIQNSVDTLVLTEWKKVSDVGRVDTIHSQALQQAQIYSQSILAGFELGSVRFLIFVSKDRLKLPDDSQIGNIKYRNINIAVAPKPPSKTV